MNGIRFYKEQSAGTVVAAFTSSGVFISDRLACYEAIAAVFNQRNSPVCGTSVSLEYLRKQCKRVNEARARKIHPRLFERLEDE